MRGLNLRQYEAASALVPQIWLDTLLLSDGLGTQKTFFSQIEVVAKPTAAILPVFFGKAPACMVDEPSFAVMQELNPQVGRVLQTVAMSDTFADVVLCLSEHNWNAEKEKLDTQKSLNELHLTASGQQVLTLFKIDKLVPYQDAQLDTVRKLRATYERLLKEKSP